MTSGLCWPTNDPAQQRLPNVSLNTKKRITPRRRLHRLIRRLAAGSGRGYREAGAKDWKEFMYRMDVAYPKLNQTLRIPFPENEDDMA